LKALALVASVALGAVCLTGTALSQSERGGQGRKEAGFDARISDNAQRMLEEGRQIFRFDTFGDEAFWSGRLKLH